MAVAESAAWQVSTGNGFETNSLLEKLRGLTNEKEWQDRLSKIESSLARQDDVSDFVRKLGLERGVTGYALNVVPVALYSWLRHRGDFRAAMVAALNCGGDTDTVGAIVGALCGARNGAKDIPKDWIDALAEWPRSTAFIRRVGERMAEQTLSPKPMGEVQYFWPGILLRNIVFLMVVLVHGLRRLLPPY